jgi:uncharacterized membrane protein HdeD (DUF308 family)
MKQDFSKNNLSVLQKQRSVILCEGFLFIVLGGLAMGMPFFFTLATEVLLGILLFVGGLMQLYRTVKTWGIESSLMTLFGALLTLFAGGVLIAQPMIGILALTAIVAIYFAFNGLARFFIGCTFTGTDRFWLMGSGLLSFVLCMMILLGLPATANWVIGLFVGIDFLVFGILATALGFSLEP